MFYSIFLCVLASKYGKNTPLRTKRFNGLAYDLQQPTHTDHNFNHCNVLQNSVTILLEINHYSTNPFNQMSMKHFFSSLAMLLLLCVAVPISADEQAVDIDCNQLRIFYNETLRTELVFGANDDYSVRIIITSANDKYGTYKVSLLNGVSATLYPLESGKDSVRIASGTFNISEQDGEDVVVGALVGKDGITYNLHMENVWPTPKETVNLQFTENSGVYYSGNFAIVDNWDEATETGADITLNLHAEDGSLAGADIMDVVIFHGENTYSGQYVKGDIRTSNDTTYLSVTALCDNEIQYNISMWTVWDYSEDAKEGAINKQYTAEDDMDAETENLLTTGSLGYQTTIYISAADESDQTVLQIRTLLADENSDMPVPAGEYPINNSGKIGTVMASRGISGEMLSPSYYIAETEDYSIPYMLTAGTVRIEKTSESVKITVEATNSHNVPVHIEYDSTKTDLHPTLSKPTQAQKYLHNGLLYILRDGKTYNGIGQRIER